MRVAISSVIVIIITMSILGHVAKAGSYLPCERLNTVGNAGACAWAGGISATCGWRASDKTCTTCFGMPKESCNTDVCAWKAGARYNYCAGKNTALYNNGLGDICHMVLEHAYLGMKACKDYLNYRTGKYCVMKTLKDGSRMCSDPLDGTLPP